MNLRARYSRIMAYKTVSLAKSCPQLHRASLIEAPRPHIREFERSGGPMALAGEYGNAAEKPRGTLDRGRALVP